MRVGIATDHGEFGLKQELLGHLGGHEVVDLGVRNLDPDDEYPDTVIPLAHAVVAEKPRAASGSVVAVSAPHSVRTKSRVSVPG